MVLSNRYSGLERQDLRLTEYRFHIYSKENCVRKLFYNFEVDPTVRSKVRALSNPYSGLDRQASASPSSDSTSTPRKPASSNSSTILRVIQRSDQKLWPFRTGTLVWSDETSASPSTDSTSTPSKTASENSSIILRVIQRSDQKLGPFRTGTLVWSDETSALTKWCFHLYSKENSVR